MTTKHPFDRTQARWVYVLVRQDLSAPQQGVQACHAAMKAVAAFGGLADDTRLTLLAVQDQAHLEAWEQRLLDKGIAHTLFFEPDYDTGWSALATAPIDAKAGKAFRALPLWNPLPA